MKILSLLLISLSLLTLCNSSSTALPPPPPPRPSFFDILRNLSLPAGLFPESVVSYTLSDDGDFVVYMAKPCYLKVDYWVYYHDEITGKLSMGSISKIKGVMIQQLEIMWLELYQMRVDLPPTDKVYFSAGFFTYSLELYKYFTVKPCTAPFLEIPSAADDSSSSVQKMDS